MQYYINTNITPASKVESIVGEQIGMNYAKTLVQEWYEKYSEFYFDDSLNDVIFFKQNYLDYWQSNTKELIKFKI